MRKKRTRRNIGERYRHQTVRNYFEDAYMFSLTATIVEIIEPAKDKKEPGKDDEGEPELYQLVLDRTIFHPQGGGQPGDRGLISSADGSVKFLVTDLKARDDAVMHIGRYIDPEKKFEMLDPTTLTIDADWRMLNTRIHSAGHLVALAMRRAGRDLKPGKGFHFYEGPYVEFLGDIPASERESLVKELTVHCAEIIAEET